LRASLSRRGEMFSTSPDATRTCHGTEGRYPHHSGFPEERDHVPGCYHADGKSARFQAGGGRAGSALGGAKIDKVAGIEARGFILGGAVAHQLSAGFVPLRKKGKLPHHVITESYELEYGVDSSMEMHTDAIEPGDRVLLVDDLIATGGTALAAIKLLRKAGAKIAGGGLPSVPCLSFRAIPSSPHKASMSAIWSGSPVTESALGRTTEGGGEALAPGACAFEIGENPAPFSESAREDVA